ncbi:hypothetical protein EV694_0151 [Volucribacter psittacicida]|uniref:ApeI dehydratase-like domain-containing protein n=1 Tax=Volucribacter psittacicida TaxID=203482 RepID=A0A4V2PCJ6_9PAST|nr:hypothetical protein [Volucribacter psittacicida]TCK01536.1 hypothetical protein EV694_0151 [Volucribacter psittacicida]
MKSNDNTLSLIQKLENQLQLHTFVDDCYLDLYLDQQDILIAWVALNPKGINYLREYGHNNTLNQLKQSLTTLIPQYWRLTDKLPYNRQANRERLLFNQNCLQQIKDPIWLYKKFEKQTALCYAKIPLDLIYLENHFANFPLVPGVIELQWIQEQINVLLKKTVIIQQISKLKFQKFLRPNDIFKLTLNWQQEKKMVIFSMQCAEENCCSGIAHYRE